MEYRVHLIFLKRSRFDVQCSAMTPVEAADKAKAAAVGMNAKPVGAVVETTPDSGEQPTRFAFRYAKSGTKPCDIEEMSPNDQPPPCHDCGCQGK